MNIVPLFLGEAMYETLSSFIGMITEAAVLPINQQPADGQLNRDQHVEQFKKVLLELFPASVESARIGLVQTILCAGPIDRDKIDEIKQQLSDAKEYFKNVDWSRFNSEFRIIAEEKLLGPILRLEQDLDRWPLYDDAKAARARIAYERGELLDLRMLVDELQGDLT